MSTQDAVEIPLSAAHLQRPFKLLELPPELLQLLESENPPKLYLRSGILPTPTTAAYAILCVPHGKTYRVQQKNTSNPIMLLEPCASTPKIEDPASTIPRPSLRTISTIEDTLELHIQESEAVAAPVKVNKWHEKFARSRTHSKTTE